MKLILCIDMLEYIINLIFTINIVNQMQKGNYILIVLCGFIYCIYYRSMDTNIPMWKNFIRLLFLFIFSHALILTTVMNKYKICAIISGVLSMYIWMKTRTLISINEMNSMIDKAVGEYENENKDNRK